MTRPHLATLVCTLSTLWACGRADVADRGVASSLEGADRGPAALAIINSSDVVGHVGPEGVGFEARLRTPELASFPCASCHVEPVSAGGRGTEEHVDVQPVHPSELAERCDACHSPADPAQLVLHNDQFASLDEAYLLCAQCHYAQADAWAGGAHGKRLAGWRGRRVVMSCTECHDSHAPTFSSRVPFRAPSIPRTGGRER